MNYIKNYLRNKLSDRYMNDCLVSYLDREILDGIINNIILRRFQKMRSRRVQLDN
jgi:hypothetical protein